MGRMPQTAEERRILKVLGENMRRCRLSVGQTQEGLAEKADLNPRTVQKIEAGKLNILATTIRRLSLALKVSSTDLLGF